MSETKTPPPFHSIGCAQDAANDPDLPLNSEHMRMVEALLFASDKPMTVSDFKQRLPADVQVSEVIDAIIEQYRGRGVQLVKRGNGWVFQTAEDLGWLFQKYVTEEKTLSRAQLETLSVIAYHQPVTRAQIEDIRGVSLSQGILSNLLQLEWIKPVGRRQVPGRPLLYGTTQAFLVHFGLQSIKDLPGLAELKAGGFVTASKNATVLDPA